LAETVAGGKEIGEEEELRFTGDGLVTVTVLGGESEASSAPAPEYDRRYVEDLVGVTVNATYPSLEVARDSTAFHVLSDMICRSTTWERARSWFAP
jgi:hypothetical protein